MRNMYEVGKVYIWQNCFNLPQYNGTECTVVGDIHEFMDAHSGVAKIGQCTDCEYDGCILTACKGMLRPKFPPSGEKSISEMFSKPCVKELDKEKELEDNCIN